MTLRIARAGWPLQFSEDAEREARSEPEDEVSRRDLTEQLVFTIDPLEAKDHDDAVGVRRTDDGGYVLGVHIADVAVRVREDGALDAEALERSTSVYPPGRVLPMLPHTLSSGACSLHHGVERDTLSVEIHYDREGNRRGVDLGLGRIRSRASLAYAHAESMLDDDGFEVPQERMESSDGSPELIDAVRIMLELARRLRERRRELGSLFVERPEREFAFDAKGHVAEVHVREPLRSHWIIEEFMLEANRAVAETLHQAELPLLWRIHEDPDEDKIDALSELLKQFDLNWVPRDPVSGHDFAELFAMVEDRPEASLIHLLALRSLMKARYRAGWDRHFGLAFEHYTHFTSPIRRYPDLHNQRWLHRLVAVAGRDGWIENAPDVAARLAVARLARPAHRADARRLADQCSEREREAQRIERDCADICAADALKEREGEEMDGMIVSVLGSGVFVELEGTGLDGFVGVEQLGRDRFRVDSNRHALVGERTGRRFRLGQRVRVLLEYVDVRNGRTWLGDLRSLPAPGRRDTPSSRKGEGA
jgi:ribonuclease R